MKKVISCIVAISMLMTFFQHSIFVNAQSSDSEFDKLIDGVDEVRLLENSDLTGKAYAVLNGIKVTITWDKISNLVTMEKQDLKQRSQGVETQSFMIEFDENLELQDEDNFTEDNFLVSRATIVKPIESILGSKLINGLVAISVAITYQGSKYVLMTKIAENLKKEKYDHYEAILRYNSKFQGYDLYLGPALDINSAAGRLKLGKDMWSVSKSKAEQLARLAGNGKTPILDRPHQNKPGYYWHYHRYDRLGGHSFYY